MELNDLEVQEELFTMATQAWADVTWIGKIANRANGSVEKAYFSKFRHEKKSDDLQSLLGAGPVIWASSGHSGTLFCLKGRWRAWT